MNALREKLYFFSLSVCHLMLLDINVTAVVSKLCYISRYLDTRESSWEGSTWYLFTEKQKTLFINSKKTEFTNINKRLCLLKKMTVSTTDTNPIERIINGHWIKLVARTLNCCLPCLFASFYHRFRWKKIFFMEHTKFSYSSPHGRRKVHDFFLLLLCKSSIWFTEKHIFKIIIYFF